MVNLLGDLWRDEAPDWREVLAKPSVKLHLYGKSEARPGRKMGHFTCLSEQLETALAMAKEMQSWLTERNETPSPVGG
jgi:5-(carboxyamino)imidazole ribonucleotide synthase